MNLIDQIVRQVSSLPKEAQVEVLDFAGYLASQYLSTSPTEDEAWDQVADREPEEDGSPKQDQ